MPILTSTDFRGLLNHRFRQNFLPIPATHQSPLGTVAPPFRLINVATGQPVRLLDFTGNPKPEKQPLNRPVVLYFTRIFTEKQYCPLCFPHIQAMNEAYPQFSDRGAEVLMITSTDLHQSEVVQRDLGLKMPLLCDPECQVFRRYQVGQALGAPLPAQFVLDRRGRIQFRHLFSFLSPNAAVETLLGAIDALHRNTTISREEFSHEEFSREEFN